LKKIIDWYLACKQTNNFIFVSHEKQISDGGVGVEGASRMKNGQSLILFPSVVTINNNSGISKPPDEIRTWKP
jgi:hypothetical protein